MEIVLRIVIIYVAIMVGLRVIGKREFGELSPLELVTLLIVPEIVSPALTRQETSLTGALIGVAVVFSCVLITSALTHRFKRLERVVVGEPAVLISNGRIIDRTLNQQRLTPDEILSEARKSGLERLDQVKWAVLETDGRISIVPFPPSEARPSQSSLQ